MDQNVIGDVLQHRGLNKAEFKLKKGVNGLLLTVHHTTSVKDGSMRIRFTNACYSDDSLKILAVDHRGNIFIFDILNKKFWKLWDRIPKKVNCIASIPPSRNRFIIGTKDGFIYIIDAERGKIIEAKKLTENAIDVISVGSKAKNSAALSALLCTNNEAILCDLQTLKQTHRLDYNVNYFSIKWLRFIPETDRIFACFTNDCMHIWCGSTLNTIRILHPVRMRDRHLKSKRKVFDVFLLPSYNSDDECCDNNSDVILKNMTKDFSHGIINSYALSQDGGYVCLTTVDDFILLISTISYDITSVIRLKDVSCKNVCFLQVPQSPIRSAVGKGLMLFILTINSDVILLNTECSGKGNNLQMSMIIETNSNSYKMNISNNGRLFSIILKSGEMNVYSTEKLVNLIKQAEQRRLNIMKTTKEDVSHPTTRVTPGSGRIEQRTKEETNLKNSKHNVGGENTSTTNTTSDAVLSPIVDNELKEILKRSRLLPILSQYGEYPHKYRSLIWRTLLELPCNKEPYMELIKKGLHPLVENYDSTYPLKDATALRHLKKIMSCLIYWCKAFGHCEFLPEFVFPFLKVFANSQLLCFELLVSLILNHCYLWFEFLPLEPFNYLGIVANALANFDPELIEFYERMNIRPKEYAWPIMSSAFSKVLDEKQWFQLWDNIISNQPYFLVFCIIAYNMLQKPVIKRLETKESIEAFFNDQNIIDVRKLVAKAAELMLHCPSLLHPKRYIKEFQKLPQGFYQKFDNYPREWIEVKHNEMDTLRIEKELLDQKVRELEQVEISLARHLEDELKQEEHQKRLKEVEKIYAEAIAKEEERTACQRKMLLLYQKQIRDRKTKNLVLVRDSAYRRNINQHENELDTFLRTIERSRLRNETDMMFADEDIKIQELNLLSNKYEWENQQLNHDESFRRRFKTAIDKLEEEKRNLSKELQNLKVEDDRKFYQDKTRRMQQQNSSRTLRTGPRQQQNLEKKISAIEDMLEQVQIEFIRTIEQPSSYPVRGNKYKGNRLKELEERTSQLEERTKCLLESMK